MEANTDEGRGPEGATPAPARASNLPLVILLVALVIWFGFQTLQLGIERSNLAAAASHQEAAMQEAQKLRAQFESLIGKTSDLANKGHVGAKLVMDELQRRDNPAGPDLPTP